MWLCACVHFVNNYYGLKKCSDAAGQLPVIDDYVRGVEREQVETVYRKKMDNIVRDLQKKLREYEKSPQTHPLYPAEWNIFWTRRSEELESGKESRWFFFVYLFGRSMVFV